MLRSNQTSSSKTFAWLLRLRHFARCVRTWCLCNLVVDRIPRKLIEEILSVVHQFQKGNVKWSQRELYSTIVNLFTFTSSGLNLLPLTEIETADHQLFQFFKYPKIIETPSSCCWLKCRIRNLLELRSKRYPLGSFISLQNLEFHRALLLKIFKSCMVLKIIYAKFQGNRFIDELAQTL